MRQCGDSLALAALVVTASVGCRTNHRRTSRCSRRTVDADRPQAVMPSRGCRPTATARPPTSCPRPPSRSRRDRRPCRFPAGPCGRRGARRCRRRRRDPHGRRREASSQRARPAGRRHRDDRATSHCPDSSATSSWPPRWPRARPGRERRRVDPGRAAEGRAAYRRSTPEPCHTTRASPERNVFVANEHGGTVNVLRAIRSSRCSPTASSRPGSRSANRWA